MALWPTPLAFFSGTKRELSRSSSCSSNSMLQVLASKNMDSCAAMYILCLHPISMLPSAVRSNDAILSMAQLKKECVNI